MATTLGAVAEGSIVYLNESGVAVPFYVAKHNYESALNGAGRTLLVRKDCYDERAWNSVASNEYASSAIDTWLNNTYVKLLGNDIQAAIGTTEFYYTNSALVKTMSRAVFVLSAVELGKSDHWGNDEGTVLPIANALQIAYRNGSAVTQWTRTVDTMSNEHVHYLSDTGVTKEDKSRNSHGSRPVFTLPADMGVDDSGNVVMPGAASGLSLANVDNTSVLLTGCLANVGGIEYAIPYALANVDGIEVMIPFGEQVSGTPLAEYAEGDIVYLNENGSPVEFYVAKHDYESGLNGAGRTLLVRKDCYDTRAWHSSSVNAYASSSIDSWINSTYKALLDANVQSAIGTTKFYYTPGNGSTSVTTLTRAIFLLSVTELGKTAGYANTEGTALPIAGSLIIAYIGGATVEQWTRTPSKGNKTQPYYFSKTGAPILGTITYARGARPCVTLPSDILVDDTGLITG